MLVPRPYQIAGRDFLAARRHALLADEMRVGKTPQAILAAHKLGVSSMLVVCPAIAVPHWRREIERWYAGPPMSRVALVSYDRLRLNAKEYLDQRWDLVVVDECHFAKNPETQRTKLIYGKEGIGWRADRMWALSGTPAPKHAAELWPMLRAFGAVGMTYAEFVRRYCTVNDFTGRITGTRAAHIPELKALLAKIMLRRTRKEVAPDMPDIDFQFLEVKPTATPGYAIPAGLADDALLEWVEAHAAVNAEDRQEVALAKVGPLVEEIVFAIENGLLAQTVVFGWHKAPLKILTATLRERGIRAQCLTGDTTPSDREIIQAGFRDGTCQAVAANILAAGTAIDLSSARHAYMLEMDWVPGNNVQAVNRLVSMEKMDKVTVDVVTWPGSTDDRVQKVLLRRVEELSKLI